jgi:hypothetical protein
MERQEDLNWVMIRDIFVNATIASCSCTKASEHRVTYYI